MYVYVVIMTEDIKGVRGVFTSGRKAREVKEMLKNKYPILNVKVVSAILDRFPREGE